MRLSFAAILLALTATSCGSLKGTWRDITHANLPDTQIEGGRVYLSAYPPIAWGDIASELRPEFNETSANAVLTKVLPITLAEEMILRRQRAAGFTANLAGTAVTKTSTKTQTENLTGTDPLSAQDSFSRTRTLTPGDRPSLDLTAPAAAADGNLGNFNAGVDPLLQYRAATALYQEIKLLNHYLTTQIADDEHDAYLVRARVTLQPFARGQPIDVYSRVWVETAHCPSYNEGIRAKGSHAARLEISQKFFGELDMGIAVEGTLTAPQAASKSNKRDADRCKNGEFRPTVIPLLITDNFERSDARRLAQAVEQLNVNISALVNGIGLGAGVNELRDELRAYRGAEYNNLQSIAQYDQNKLLIRFGAAHSPESAYEMRPQTYDVAFVVLIPRAGKQKIEHIKIRESSNFRNARNGVFLRPTDKDFLNESAKELSRRMEYWGFTKEARKEAAKLLKTHKYSTLRNDKFDHKYDNNTSLDSFPTLYDFVYDLEDITNISTVVASLPATDPVLPPIQTATLVDVSNSGSIVRLAGAKRITDVRHIQAKLFGSSGKTFNFAAQQIAIDKNGGLAFKFPSLSAHGIMKTDKLKLQVTYSRHHQTTCVGTMMGTKSCTYDVIVDIKNSKPSKETFAFEVSTFLKTIPIDANNNGTIRLLIKPEKSATTQPAQYQITVEGATLDSAVSLEKKAQTTLKPTTNSVTTDKPGIIDLKLTQLVTNSEIKLSFKALDAKGKPDKTIKTPTSIEIKLVKNNSAELSGGKN